MPTFFQRPENALKRANGEFHAFNKARRQPDCWAPCRDIGTWNDNREHAICI